MEVPVSDHIKEEIFTLDCSSFSFFFTSQIFKEREEDLRRLSRPLECACFRTSIWDETLYKVCTPSPLQLAFFPLPA